MNAPTETMSLVCGDSMLEGLSMGVVDGGMIQAVMDGGMMGGAMGPWMLVGWLVPLLVLVGLGALALWAIRTLAGDSGGGSTGSDALEVARQRYARGEIDREEFARIRSDLASG